LGRVQIATVARAAVLPSALSPVSATKSVPFLSTAASSGSSARNGYSTVFSSLHVPSSVKIFGVALPGWLSWIAM